MRQTNFFARVTFSSEFSEDSYGEEKEVDRPYLQKLLMQFLPFLPIALNEVHMEYKSDKCLIGGSFDVIIGSSTNGKKPYIFIEGKEAAVHLGSIIESKPSEFQFTRKKATEIDKNCYVFMIIINNYTGDR